MSWQEVGSTFWGEKGVSSNCPHGQSLNGIFLWKSPLHLFPVLHHLPPPSSSPTVREQGISNHQCQTSVELTGHLEALGCCTNVLMSHYPDFMPKTQRSPLTHTFIHFKPTMDCSSWTKHCANHGEFILWLTFSFKKTLDWLTHSTDTEGVSTVSQAFWILSVTQKTTPSFQA